MTETSTADAVAVPSPLARIAARRLSLAAAAIFIGLPAAKILLQFAGIHRYGFFRDELYYLACGQHLAWGYIDQPPLIAFIAWFARHALGGSMVAVRILPILAGAAVVFLTALLASELGGGRFAQLLAALVILFAPAYLAFDSFLSMNAFEPLFWTLCAWLVVRIVKGSTPRLWLAFGAIAGVGLENKHTMLVFGFSLAAGLLLSGRARLFASKWIWLGALLAFAIFLPNLLWEFAHHFPQIEVVRNAQQFKNLPVSPLGFLGQQILFLGPVAFPLWLAGLAWLFFDREGKRFRFLGWTYLIVLAIFICFDGKSYYPLPVYPLLAAAGAIAFERFCLCQGTASAVPIAPVNSGVLTPAAKDPSSVWSLGGRSFSSDISRAELNGLQPLRKMSSARRALAFAYPAVLVLAGLITVPFGVPVLPVNTFLRYSAAFPYARDVKTERDSSVALPQLYADMFGWPGMASTVARVYNSLPPADRADCAILAGNYGEAGAIDYYGPALGLPPALSGHNSYYDWGPRHYSGSCVIIFGERATEFSAYFRDVRRVATISNPHAMAVEQNVPVFLCRQPVAPLSVLWPHFRMII